MSWKKSFRLALIFAVLYALLLIPSTAYAQNLSFTLDEEVVDVWINQDGSISIEYWFTFTADPGADPITVVDVGLPNSNFSLSDINADVDGAPVDRIDTDYEGQGTGVAVWLGQAQIDPGETGTVHVQIDRVGMMVYEDSEDPEYASTEFSPTWFGSSVVHGTTDLTVRFHLPEGVQPEEPRWHRSPSGWPQSEPNTALDDEGRVLYIWNNPTAEPDRQYTFGASFPREYVDEDVIQEGPSTIEQIFSAFMGALSCCCNPLVIFFGIFIGFIGLGIWGNRRRKMQYLPPSMKVEGVGIKRGLTAVEAAILLETPLNKVLTMILFGLVKKRAITVQDDDPLKVETNEPLPEDLRYYEKDFLEAVKKDQTLAEGKLQKMMISLVDEVNNKMKGFSRKESVKYYQDIVNRAWDQVEKADTPEVRGERFDEQLEWTMLDDDFEDRMETTFRNRSIHLPPWWIYYRPWTRGRTATTGTVGTGGGRRSGGGGASTGRVQLPTLPGLTFAATMVRGVESTASRIVRSVTGFTGGVTNETNPPPQPSSSGARSSGGSGCACACACACAGCACACAGGGR